MPVVLVEKQSPQISIITLNRPERRNALTIELMTELTEGYENLERARASILILRENVLPGADEALKATTEGYESGRFSYLDILEARKTTGAARIQYLQALTDYHKALHAVEALTADPRPHNLP